MSRMTLLVFTTMAEADAVGAALAGVPGPDVLRFAAGAVVCFAEAAGPPRGRAAIARALARRQLRLERAGLAGAFLPADPGAATATAAELPVLLAAEAPALAEAIARHGRARQWDLIVSWPVDVLLAPHRDALGAARGREALAEAVRGALAGAIEERRRAFLAALGPVAAATAPLGATDTQCAMTLLLDPADLPALEQALAALPEAVTAGASADLRGPMPAVSFASVRLLPAADMAAAWAVLDLPGRITAPELQAHWRRVARRAHPDHAGGDGGAMAAATAAFRAVQAALRGFPAGAAATVGDLAARGRLVLPEARP